MSMQIKKFLDKKELESWENMHPDLKASLKKGLAQSDKGEVTSHQKVMKKIRAKWCK